MIVSHSGIDLVETSGETYLKFCKLYKSPPNTGQERINSHLLASNQATQKGDVKFTESKNGNKSEEGEAYYTNFTQEDVMEIRKDAEETGKPSMALMHMEASIHAGNWQRKLLSRR